MTITEKNLKSRAVQLSGYEVRSLEDAKETLNLLFGKVCSKDNQIKLASILTGLEELIAELSENNNQIIEFNEMED